MSRRRISAAAGVAALLCAWMSHAATPDRFERVRRVIQDQMIDDGVPSMVVAVAERGKVVWEEGFGWADIAGRKPATPDTIYSLASVSKSFTATALMRLVEQGAVDLDAPVNRYLGDAPLVTGVGNMNDATVRRVANHTSGLPLHYQFFYAGDGAIRPPIEETIRRYGKLMTPPGAVFTYSNLGYGVLECVIQHVSGTPYEAFMAREVFGPLGLSSTRMLTAPDASGRVAKRYARGGVEVPFYDFDHRGASAVFASARDLLRYGMFHLGDPVPEQARILSPGSLKSMQVATAHDAEVDGQKAGYGIGWQIQKRYGKTLVLHGGRMAGVATRLTLIPEDDVAIVILANFRETLLDPVEASVVHALLPETIHLAERYRPPREWVGQWHGAIATSEGRTPLEIAIEANGRVTVRVGDAEAIEVIEVQRNASGGLVLTGVAGTIAAKAPARYAYDLRMTLRLDGDVIYGATTAESRPLQDRRGSALSYWTELKRFVPLSQLSVPAFADDWQDRYFDLLPQPAQVSAAQRADALAWLNRQAGRQELWVTRGADSQLVYRYEDDGQAVSGLTISPDGAWLAYVRGSVPNAQGEVSNPLNLPDVQQRVLWMIPAQANATPRRVAGDGSPVVSGGVFSPDGALLAWTAGRDAWALDLKDGAAQPRRLFTIRGTASELAWSPDARRLGFVSRRGTHGFVGVLDLASREIRYLSPGIDSDQMPAWSPEGRYLAFLRVPEPVQSYRFTPRLTSIPWSIMLADFETGDVRTLWTAEQGLGSTAGKAQGSARGENGLRTPLLWTHDRHLVFSWERTGWSRLYRINIDSGSAVLLTEGDGEIPAAALSQDGRSVYYVANALERERFELYQVDAKGGVAQRISAGLGAAHRQPPVALVDGRVAFLGYDAHTPAQVMTVGARGEPVAVKRDLVSPAFPADALVKPQVVEIVAEDGVQSNALLFRPKGVRKDAKRPAVLYAHGGSRLIETFEPHHGWGFVEALVQRGYVVLAPNYRSGIGYGLAFREAPGYGGSGGTDTRDIIAAGRFLAGLPDVNPRRMGIFGISYGGYLTTHAMARAPELWAAGASLVGVADWQMEMELDRGGAPLPFRLSQRMQYEDLAFESSASAHLDRWRAPILFVSGDDDADGWLAQAIELGQRLRSRGIEVEALVEPGGTHSAATQALLRARLQRMLTFFDRHLGR